MNFVKRAALSLVARRAKTALLLGIFLVICTLLLGGFLLQDATSRQEAEAQRRIGVDVTVRGDRLTLATAAALGSSPLVERYNPLLRGAAKPSGLTPLTSDVPEPDDATDDPGHNGLMLNGIRDSEMLLDFASGRSRIVAGRALTEKDAGRRVVLLERRLADKNELKAGDTVGLRSSDGRRTETFEIIGLYEDPRPDPSQWVAPSELIANQVYAPAPAVSALGFGTKPSTAVFKIGSPERAERLHAEAARVLGGDGFRFDVNDKAFRDQVLPLRRVGAFAGSLLWLIALSGAVILGLIVLLTIKERRDELGMLLALGEKKWKLIAQHTVEVTALLLPALAVAALGAQSFAEEAGETLLAREEHTASLPEVRMEAADLGRVAGIGLGISLVATVVPGAGILRLHPRSILTDTE
ncbi:ABC transporter permease [Streptomyces niveus]|uniref:ABC transporter permease n=1 Tax=Streptomyces niveus TaxID=193462 RepID=A0ABZ2A3C9_STRNV|nr:ABC transporter permease [Streptomyces niveus]